MRFTTIECELNAVGMQWIWLHLVLGFAIIVSGSALPDDFLRSLQNSSRDNTCGIIANDNFLGYSCDPKSRSPCCGSEGYCGQLLKSSSIAVDWKKLALETQGFHPSSVDQAANRTIEPAPC